MQNANCKLKIEARPTDPQDALRRPFAICHLPFAICNAARAAMFLIVIALLAGLSSSARADEYGDACRRYHDHWRAGWPQCPAPWAKCSESPRECGYYVGGGAACFGDGRCRQEGTWGWDYQGLCHCKRVWLGWHHGCRHQGGSGAYKTDGPKLPLCE